MERLRNASVRCTQRENESSTGLFPSRAPCYLAWVFQLQGIDHVALAVRDLARSTQWYIDVLGFQHLYPGMWGGVPVFVGNERSALALFPTTRDGNANARGIRMLHVAFGTTREQFLAAQRHLNERGIAFEFQDHEISHSIYFRDPDGHELEITTYELG